MGQRVLTYRNKEQLYASDSIFMKEYNDAIHITATTSLRRALVENNSQRRWIEAPIISFGQLVKHIGYGWFKSKTILKQLVELTKIYNMYGKQNQSNKEIFKAFDRNQQDVLLTMRALIEAAFTTKNDLQFKGHKLTSEEKMFFELFLQFENHKSVNRYRNWFNDFYSGNEELLADVLIQTFTEMYRNDETRRASNSVPKMFSKKEVNEFKLNIQNHEQDDKVQKRKIIEEKVRRKAVDEFEKTFKKKKVLIFHGFYFITPVQQLFFEGLKRFANIEIVHLIHYDKDYPQIFETVERFIDLGHAEQVSNSMFPINTLANRFANSLAGDQTPINTRTSHYYSFSHLYQFKNYIEQDNEKRADIIFSPRAKAVEKYISDLESANNAKLKDYPIGQFLLDLHRFNQSEYDIEEGGYTYKENLNSDVLIRLFNSGYLYIPKENKKFINGNFLVDSLKKLEPIVKGCITFEQWEETLIDFIRQKKALEKSMEPKSYSPSIEKDLYIYQHQSLAYFNVSIGNLNLILKGIYLLKEFYEHTYTGETLSIGDYINKLQQFMKENVTRFMVDKAERKLSQKLLSELNELKDDEDFEGINRRDIIKGLSFFLSKKNEDSTMAMEQLDDMSLDKRVRALVDGDGIIFEGNRNVHLAFMDNMVLPISQNLSLWPIKEKTLNFIISNGKTKLKQVQLRKEMGGSITAYLLYLIMQNASKLTFSFVRSFEAEENLYPSFYMELLGLKPRIFTPVPVTEDKMDEQYNESTIKQIEVLERNKSFILDKTASACQRRFVMSYLLQKRPDFESDFHHQFIYSSIYSFYRRIVEKEEHISKDMIVNYVNSMFPQWTDTKKKILLQQADKFKLNGLKLEKIEDLRIFTLPRPLSLIGLNKDDYKNKPTTFATKSSKCMYCPFSLKCREAGEVNEDA